MSDEKLIDKNWVDIVPIQFVDEPDYMLMVMLSSGILLAISIAFYFYARRSNYFIRRKLNSLASQVKRQDNKTILFDLEKVLCGYFQVSQLSLITVTGISISGISSAGLDPEQVWPEFKSHLHESCYSSSLPDDETTHNLIQQAKLLFMKSAS